MPTSEDRREALAVLRLAPSADEATVKRAYRRLARDLHPDRGGDADRFHELQRAYEVLRGGDAATPPRRAPGRPSRPPAAWDADRADRRVALDVDAIAWDAAEAASGSGLDVARLARLVVAPPGDAPVRTAIATSRAPGSRLNRAAPRLAPDLTAELRVAAARDDRGRPAVSATVRAGTRRARRAVETVGLDGGWTRSRRSSSTTLTRLVPPDPDPRTTALRTATAIDELLDRLAWPLTSWIPTEVSPDTRWMARDGA